MKTENEQKKEIDRTIKVDDIVSVPFGNKFLIGVVKDISKENITINNYTQNNISIPNNDNVYKFFPGQKFDFREFYKVDGNTPENLSVSERMNKFLSKTTVGSFSEFCSKNKADLVQLLKGNLTNNLYNGNSIITNEKGEKNLQSWACKFQLYRGKDGNLKMNTAWKQEKLQTKVYGVELTPEQLKNTIEKNQSIVIDRQSKEQIPFKAFCKFDKDLNSFVTSQYSEKIEELMKKSYAKKEGQTHEKSLSPTNTKERIELKEIKEDKGISKREKKGRGI
jgi:hypothetical protein